MEALSKKYIPVPAKGLEQQGVEEFLNCFEKGGKLLPRQGLRANKNNLFHYNDGSFDADVYFQTTDCHIYLNGKYGRIAIRVSDNMMDNITLYPMLITEDGKITQLSYLEFSRIDSYTFGRPDTYTVFGGNPVVGKGIFFIARLVYGEGIEDFVRVWELSEAMDMWIPLSENEIYIPTLMINGRGNRYYLATLQEKTLDIPEPSALESRNLLSGRFRAKFTADSASCRFALPLQGLDDLSVICTYSADDKDYKWVIPADNYFSADVIIGDKTVRMLCDRERGEVYFKNPDGIDYAPEYCGKTSNITVTASKEIISDKVKVASKASCICPEGQTVKRETAVTVFYGGWQHPNLVVWNSPLHPLYFPADSVAYVGQQALGVKKMATKDDILVAFKEDRVFAATLPTAENFSLSFKTSVALPDRVLPSTVGGLNDELIFATSGGRLMRLYGSTAATLRVEEIVEERFSLNASAFGLEAGDRYMLFCGDTAQVISKQDSGYSRGCWKFGAELIGGVSNLGKAVLFATLWQEGVSLVYPLTFSGTSDSRLAVVGGTITEEELPFAARVTTELLPRSAAKYRLYGIRVEGKGPFTLSLTDNTPHIQSQTLDMKDARGYHLWGRVTDSPMLTVEFSGHLCGVALKYRALNRM